MSISAAVTTGIISGVAAATGTTAAAAAAITVAGVSVGTIASVVGTIAAVATAVSAVSTVVGIATGDKTFMEIGQISGLVAGGLGGVAAIGSAVGPAATAATSSTAANEVVDNAMKTVGEQTLTDPAATAAKTAAPNFQTAAKSASQGLSSAASDVSPVFTSQAPVMADVSPVVLNPSAGSAANVVNGTPLSSISTDLFKTPVNLAADSIKNIGNFNVNNTVGDTAFNTLGNVAPVNPGADFSTLAKAPVATAQAAANAVSTPADSSWYNKITGFVKDNAPLLEVGGKMIAGASNAATQEDLLNQQQGLIREQRLWGAQKAPLLPGSKYVVNAQGQLVRA